MIYAFIIFSNITFYRKLFSDCCNKFDFPGSIVYLSFFISFGQITFRQLRQKNMFLVYIDKKYSLLVAQTIKNAYPEIF